MSHCLIVAAVLASAAAPQRSGGARLADFSREYETATDLVTVKLFVTGEDLRHTPSWRADQENPPLSARKALRIADEEKARLLAKSKPETFKFYSLTLEEAGEGKWYWRALYFQERPGGTGVPVSFTAIVLMNGKVVKPF